MTPTLLYRVAAGQGLAVLVEQPSGKRAQAWLATRLCAAERMCAKQLPGLLPQVAIDDWLVLARVAVFNMANFADVGWVREQLIQLTPGIGLAAHLKSVLPNADLRDHAAVVQLLFEQPHRFQFSVA